MEKFEYKITKLEFKKNVINTMKSLFDMKPR